MKDIEKAREWLKKVANALPRLDVCAKDNCPQCVAARQAVRAIRLLEKGICHDEVLPF